MKTKIKKTKKAYEEYLNNNSHFDSDEYIIGGKKRETYYWSNRYGTALRKYDPIAFEVGYNEWRKEL